jgi:predicted transcriptional regulator
VVRCTRGAKEPSIRNDSDLQLITVELPRLLVERLQMLGLSLERSASSIIKQSLEGFLDDLSDSDTADRTRDLGASLRQAGRLRLMRQCAARGEDA